MGKLTTSHGGAIEGTSTSLVHRHDGVAWVVLFSAHSSPSGGTLSGLISEALGLAVDTVRTWPDHDLFETYQ